MSIRSTIALITGANQGIGFAAAKKLAKHHKYHILMGVRDMAKGEAAAAQLKAEGLSVEPLLIDLVDDASIAAAAAKVASQFGRLDVLINNAAVAVGGPAAEVTRANFRQAMETNVYGHAEVMKAFAPLLEQSAETPRVVFVTSGMGSLHLKLHDPYSRTLGYLEYRCTKSALNMVMLHWAVMYEEKGWKINGADPGYCATNLNAYQGMDSPESGAEPLVQLATLGPDGPSGTVLGKNGPVEW